MRASYYGRVLAAGALAGLLAAPSASAGSGNHDKASLEAASLAPASGRISSPHYSIDTELGAMGGNTDTDAAAASQILAGFVGNIYSVTQMSVSRTEGGAAKGGLRSLSPSGASVTEGGTLNVDLVATLDDGSVLPLTAEDANWRADRARGVSGTGTAVYVGAVYKNSEESYVAQFGDCEGVVTVSVVDQHPDDYGRYAADGVPDVWQVTHFGEDNPAGQGGADADGDGQNNRFEYLAKLDPLDPSSAFELKVEPGKDVKIARVVFSPRWDDRNYRLVASTNLTSGAWVEQAGVTQDDGTERSVEQPVDGASRRFYRVVIAEK